MKILLIPIIILLISCSDTKSEQGIKIPKVKNEWTIFNTKDSIPELFTLSLKEIWNGEFKIANPNENYCATDVVLDDSIPTRQLRLLCNNGNLWRMAYIQGGFGKHYVYTECKIYKDSISDFRITQTLLTLESNDSIEKYLTENKLVPKEVKIVME